MRYFQGLTTALILITLCHCESPSPSLVRFTHPRGFFHDNTKFENTLFYTDDRTVFPLCTTQSGYAHLCSTAASNTYYFRENEVTRIGTFPALPQWKLRFAEMQHDQLLLFLDPPPGNLVELSLHPLLWLQPTADGLISLHLSPVVPGLQFSTHDIQAADIGPLSIDSSNPYELVLRFKPPALIGYEIVWQDRLRASIKFKRAFAKKPILVIDAGHGGEESGACENSLCEKELTLRAAQQLQQSLHNETTTVLLTRDTDTTISLYERVLFAEKAKADLLLSLHVDNWSEGGKLRTPQGLSCYYFQPLSRQLTQQLCGQDLSEQDPFANWITKRSLHLLHSTNFPSVLIELANFADDNERMIVSDAHRFQTRVDLLAKRIREILSFPLGAPSAAQ